MCLVEGCKNTQVEQLFGAGDELVPGFGDSHSSRDVDGREMGDDGLE